MGAVRSRTAPEPDGPNGATDLTAPTESATDLDPDDHRSRSDPTAPRDVPRVPWSRLVAPALVAAALQVLLWTGERLPSVDGLAYFEAGRSWFDGAGFARHGSPELHFPPLAPVALAGLERLTGSELAALRVWNLLTGVAVVVLLVALAHRWWRDPRTTVTAAWLAGTVTGLVPLFARHGGGSEAAALALLLAAVLAAQSGLHAHRPLPRAAGSAVAGISVGLAYLARPEALLPGLVVGLGLLVAALRPPRDRTPATQDAGDTGAEPVAGRPEASLPVRVLRDAAPFGVALALCVAPYVSYLHSHTGSWSPTSKTQDVSLEAWRGAAADDRLARDRELYAIQPDGVSLGGETRSLTALAREDPSGWAGIVRTNVATLGRIFVVPETAPGPVPIPGWGVIPIVLLPPALAELWRTRRRWTTRVMTGMAVVPLVSSVAFFALTRYLVLTAAVLTLYAAAGLARWTVGRSRPVVVAVAVVVATTMATSTYIDVRPMLPWETDFDPTEQAEAGRWIAENTPPDTRVMTRSFHVQGYAEREVVALPAAEYDEVLEFARRMGVDLIVADQSNVRARRPELVDDLLGDEAPPGLELVHRIDGRGRKVLIYRLDPPAPPTDEGPLYLGYVSD